MAGIEKYILAGAILGEHICFVSPPGTAKTTLVRNFFKAMGIPEHEIIVYSTPNLNFEDLIGFPMPVTDSNGRQYLTYQAMHSLDSEGNVDVSPLNTLIWGKRGVLLDELNRATPQIQNKLLNLVREKQCLGTPVKSLEFIWGAMNELNERGTKPLDNAFADRFMLFVPLRRYKALSDREKDKVILNITSQDVGSLNIADEVVSNSELINYINNCRDITRKIIIGELDFGIQAFVKTFCDAYHKGENKSSKNPEIDGRRVGMIYRTLCALAAQFVVDNKFEDFKNETFLTQSLIFSFPQKVTLPEAIQEETIKAAVRVAKDCLVDNTSPISKYFKMNDRLPEDLLVEMMNDDIVAGNMQLLSQGVQYCLNKAENTSAENHKILMTAIGCMLPYFAGKIGKDVMGDVVNFGNKFKTQNSYQPDSGNNSEFLTKLSAPLEGVTGTQFSDLFNKKMNGFLISTFCGANGLSSSSPEHSKAVALLLQKFKTGFPTKFFTGAK